MTSIAAVLACSASSGPHATDVAPVTMLVRASGADTTQPADGSAARPYPTIAAALRDAPAGAMISIDEGDYRERLVVARPVMLVGRGAARTRILTPEGDAPAILVRPDVDHVRLQGFSVEGGVVGVLIAGGLGHHVQSVELRGMSESALVARDAEVLVRGSTIRDVANTAGGRAIDVEGGSLTLHEVSVRSAARRAIQIRKGKAVLESVDVERAGLSALQALDGADVRISGGRWSGMGGAALYAAASKLSVSGAHVDGSEFAVVGYRGAEVAVSGAQLTAYRVAAVAFVNASGAVRKTHIAQGGSEAGITVTGTANGGEVTLADNVIEDPGPFGIHIAQSSVTARGNTITGARHDREGDMGDGFFALDATLVAEGNVVRGNAGSGLVAIRSKLELTRNGIIGNGRSGALLLDASRVEARQNWFDQNHAAAVEVGEGANALLDGNRFGRRGMYDIDAGCGTLAGVATVTAANTFLADVRWRACP